MTKTNLSIIDILQNIKAGTFDAATLHKETRQACVEVLMLEGYHQSTIASLLKTSDRTIRRDAVDIRKRNSLRPSPEMTGMLVGDLMATARTQYARFRQIARSKGSSSQEVLKAELFAWKVIKESFEKLNSIGFLGMVEDQKGDTRLAMPASEEPKAVTKSKEFKAIEAQYTAMSAMDKERLIEKLRHDIVGLDEEPEVGQGVVQ